MYNGYGFEQPDFSGVGSLAPQMGPLNIATPQIKRGGMFGGKGAQIGEAISAALNGYLAAGGNPAGLAGLQQIHQQRMYQQEQAMRDQEYQQHRTDENTDWMSRYKYEIDNPKPSDSEFERVAAAAGYAPGTPEYIALMKQKAQTMADPPRYQYVNGVGLVQVGGAGGAAPSAPAKPLTDEDIDRMSGGAGGNASGNFPY